MKKYEERTIDVLADLVPRTTYNTQDLPYFLKSESALDHVRHRADFQQIERDVNEKYAKLN